MLHWAFREAVDPVTQWRMHYDIPPCDPMLENITEEEIYRDLLVIAMHEQRKRQALDPEGAAVAEIAGSAEKFGLLKDAAERFLAKASTKVGHARITKGGTPEELQAKKRPLTIRIGGRVVTKRPTKIKRKV